MSELERCAWSGVPCEECQAKNTCVILRALTAAREEIAEMEKGDTHELANQKLITKSLQRENGQLREEIERLTNLILELGGDPYMIAEADRPSTDESEAGDDT